MVGTLVNAAAVAAGTAVGRLGGSRLPERVRVSLTSGLGLFTLALGAQGALRTFERGRLADVVVVVVGLLVGGASILTILVYQGGLTLGASAIHDAFTPDVLRALDAAGGLLILGIGLRLLDVKDVRVGNFLPALILVPLGAWLVR